MPAPRRPLAWLACLVLAFSAAPALAQTPNPLRLVPAEADLVLALERPRQLVDAVLGLDAIRQLKELEAVREFYSSTNYRRFDQLVTHFEKKLGADRLELLDKLAGGGAVLATKFSGSPAPVVLVLQSKDEKTLKEFMNVALEVAEDEIARQEGKDKIERGNHRGVDGVRIGKELHLAVAGSALLVSNNGDAMKRAIDLHVDGDAKSVLKRQTVADARKLVGDRPLGWLWIDFEKARAAPQFKVTFDTFTLEPATALVVGGMGDVLRRTPSLVAGLTQRPDGFSLDFRLPRGRDGMGEPAKLVLPGPDEGSLPPLEPKNVAISVTQYLDLGKVFENRTKLLNKEALKGVDELEKQSALFLGGTKLSKLLGQAGPHQRFVYVQQTNSTVYKTAPKKRFGAFGLVQDMRDPEFGSSLEFILRSAAIIGAFQANLKLAEETRGDVKIVAYRFPEDGKFKGDPDGNRFNFSPCFAIVGNQLVVSSTIELGRELVDLVKKEDDVKAVIHSPSEMRFYATGLAAGLRATEEELVTKAILEQGLAPEAARGQVKVGLKLVEQLGTLRLRTTYNANDTTLSLHFVTGGRKE